MDNAHAAKVHYIFFIRRLRLLLDSCISQNEDRKVQVQSIQSLEGKRLLVKSWTLTLWGPLYFQPISGLVPRSTQRVYIHSELDKRTQEIVLNFNAPVYVISFSLLMIYLVLASL